MRNSRATLDDPRCALKFNATRSGAGELSASGNLLDDGRWPVYSYFDYAAAARTRSLGPMLEGPRAAAWS